MKIFKYRLNGTQTEDLKLPAGTKILKVAWQDNQITLWAEVDPLREEVDNTFHVFGTGWEMNSDGLIYLDSVLTPAGFVWHVYHGENNETNT